MHKRFSTCVHVNCIFFTFYSLFVAHGVRKIGVNWFFFQKIIQLICIMTSINNMLMGNLLNTLPQCIIRNQHLWCEWTRFFFARSLCVTQNVSFDLKKNALFTRQQCQCNARMLLSNISNWAKNIYESNVE